MGNFTRWLWASLYTLYNKKNGVYLTRVQYEEDATRIIMGGPLLAQHFPSHGKKKGVQLFKIAVERDMFSSTPLWVCIRGILEHIWSIEMFIKISSLVGNLLCMNLHIGNGEIQEYTRVCLIIDIYKIINWIWRLWKLKSWMETK